MKRICPWIHAQLGGNLIHLHFRCEGGRSNSESPHGTGRRPVGINAIALNRAIGNVVRAADQIAVLVHHVGAQSGVGACVMDAGDLAGDNASIFLNPIFDFDVPRPRKVE